MPKSASELLLYGLLIAGFLLFNYVMQRLAKKARQQPEQEWGQQQEAAPSPEDEPLEDIRGRRPRANLPAAAAPVEPARCVAAIAAAPAPPPPRRTAAGPIFRSRKDLRHAVVLMTVLGPCRALKPDD